MDNLKKSRNRASRKICDHIWNNDLPCGRGTGDSIQGRLISLPIQIQGSSHTDRVSQTKSTLTTPGVQLMENEISKRDFLKVPRSDSEQ